MHSPRTLYIVATPIGNLADISNRAIDILKQVDTVLVEDTRHSKILLNHIGSGAKMLALHDHNERVKTKDIIDSIEDGKSIALISDAGTPLISDPGYHLVRYAHEAGVKVSPIPGPCAAIAALSVSSLSTSGFFFKGFLPATSSKRKAELCNIKNLKDTTIFYEAPHRIKASITDMIEVLGNRKACIAREISKQYEQIVSADLKLIADYFLQEKIPAKGEFVIVIEGFNEEELLSINQHDDLLNILLEEMPTKSAANIAAKITGASKRDLYQRALELKP